MWPVLLDMSQDDCRRTLRRFELEAYSKMMSVFRAQGALEDSRKKLLEDLRGALRIGADRHGAEARRVANDELLATIAHQLNGPNTGLGWISEGRRRVPLMPRGIPQTAYTELADEVARASAEENRELLKKEAQKLLSRKSNEERKNAAEEKAEDAMEMDESMFPPLVIEDPTAKIWENEVASRKRKVPEAGVSLEEITPVKNVRNIPVNTNQKHLNLSQIYSKFSQPASSKSSGHSKHSYNQVSKVSTNKTHTPRQAKQPKTPKPRAPKTPKAMTKAQMKKAAKEMLTPTKYSPPTMQYSPNSFQASYAQSLMDPNRNLFPEEVIEGRKNKEVSTTPHELTVAAAVDDPALRAHTHTHTHTHTQHTHTHATSPHTISGKPSQLVIKKKGDITTERKETKVVQKASEIKLFGNRQMMVTPGGHKTLGTPGKFITTKVIGPVGKTMQSTSVGEKVIVMSKPLDHKTLGNSKIIIPSSSSSPVTSVISSPRLTEAITPKGIPATDLKVSAAKTFLLNPKSGQKMVVVPAKARTKTGADGSPVPLIQLKGMPTTMRLVPVSQQHTPVKATTVTVISKSSINTPSTPKVVSVEQIKTANMADIVPVKGLTPSTPKLTNAIVRTSSSKGSVIVVQKGASLGKALTFSKNPSDMNKIIMGKNITQLMQAKQDSEASKGAGNVILLDLNNDQSSRPTTMSEILDSRGSNPREPVSRDDSKKEIKITEDTPVLFDSQITDETCSANSLDSATESIGDMVPLETIQNIEIIEKAHGKLKDPKDNSSVTDWEMELDATATTKDKDEDDKLNSLHLDLGMSSDSDSDFIDSGKKKHSPQVSIPRTTPSAESRETFDSSSGLSHATRTLLSQLQDEGSSSNDSSFALKSKILEKRRDELKESGLNKSESEALSKAKERLSEKVAKSQQKRIDIYSTAISSADINLDSFSYLEEGMMVGDEEFPPGDAAASSPSK